MDTAKRMGCRSVPTLCTATRPTSRFKTPIFNCEAGPSSISSVDSFSEARSPAFATQLLAYVQRFNGRVVHTKSVPVTTPEGAVGSTPIIIIYEVHP